MKLPLSDCTSVGMLADIFSIFYVGSTQEYCAARCTRHPVFINVLWTRTLYTRGDHVCDHRRLVSTICLAVSSAVAPGSCGLTHLSVLSQLAGCGVSYLQNGYLVMNPVLSKYT